MKHKWLWWTKEDVRTELRQIEDEGLVVDTVQAEFDRLLAPERAVYPCFDTDCNGATVGSIMGMMLGAEALPSKWTSVMNDTVHTGLSGYHVSRISQLADEMYQLHVAAEESRR